MNPIPQLPRRGRLIDNRLVGRVHALHSDRRGQDVLEFALLTPFVLFFIFVLVDFGLAAAQSHQINHAVREATRAGAVGSDEATIRQTAIDQSLDLLGGSAAICPLAAADDACLEVTWNDGPDGNITAGDSGDAVTVRARYRYKFLNPFISWLPFTEFELGACADSRLEVAPASPADHGWDCSS